MISRSFQSEVINIVGKKHDHALSFVISNKTTIISRNTAICANNISFKIYTAKVSYFLMLSLVSIFINHLRIF